MTPSGDENGALRAFNMLNYAHAVRSAADSKNRHQVAWLRLRGALDLYEG